MDTSKASSCRLGHRISASLPLWVSVCLGLHTCVAFLGSAALVSESSCDWSMGGLGDAGGEQGGRPLWPHEGVPVF